MKPNESCLCIIQYEGSYYEPCFYNKKEDRFYCLSNGGAGFIGDYFDGDDSKVKILTQSMSFSEIAEGIKELVGKSYIRYSKDHDYIYTKQNSASAGSFIYDPRDSSKIMIVTKVTKDKIFAKPYMQYINDAKTVEFDATEDIKSFSSIK